MKFQKIQSTYVDPLDAGSVPIPRSAVGESFNIEALVPHL